jgi:hypothetical protein
MQVGHTFGTPGGAPARTVNAYDATLGERPCGSTNGHMHDDLSSR